MILRNSSDFHFTINGKIIVNVVFFRDGEIIMSSNRPFISVPNSCGVSKVIDSCNAIKDVASARKIDLNRKHHFLANEGHWYKSDTSMSLFLYAGSFDHVGKAYEILQFETELERHYSLALDITATWDDETEPRTIKVVGQHCVRREMTEQGKLAEQFAEIINKTSISTSLSTQDAHKLLTHRADILKFFAQIPCEAMTTTGL
ncbi:hypothetical protein ACI2KR_31700 [Pseudomonas luteola]